METFSVITTVSSLRIYLFDMAGKIKKNSKKPQAKMRVRVRKHIETLGLTSADGYMRWCLDNGFKASLSKNADELNTEKSAYDYSRKHTRMVANIHRNPKKLIKETCAGKIKAEEITRPFWKDFCRSILQSGKDKDSRSSLCELLLKVYQHADFLTESTSFGDQTFLYADALILLNNRRRQWVRSINSWSESSHNKHRQFSSLARHLLATYSVPVFMDSAWFRRDKGSYRMRDWFIHIGSGGNIRTAKTPIRLTKLMAHHFLKAPDDYSIENAFRWGQVHSLGGDSRLTEAILGTRIGNSFDNDDFWLSVIRFFIANPLLDRRHVGPIIDFLNYQKFETQEIVVGPGVVEQRQPPQPGLSMSRRTPANLLRQVERWHKELGRSVPAKKLYFKRSGISGYEVATGKDERHRVWRIREILSGSELVAEGKAMHHCVATYAPSCASGKCSIWTMELLSAKQLEKRQTIEVNRNGVITESRGKCNRFPTLKEYGILRQWADIEGLTISRYIRPEG